MELWDLYDRNKNPLGKTHERGKPLAEGEYHLTVDILSVNREGNILITKRHPNKPHGGKWEISGGSVQAGETSVQGAARELFEETGLKADENELVYCGSLIRDCWNGIMDYYLYKGDFSEDNVLLQEEETVDFRFVTPQELREMYENGEFIDFIYERISVFHEEQIKIKNQSKE